MVVYISNFCGKASRLQSVIFDSRKPDRKWTSNTHHVQGCIIKVLVSYLLANIGLTSLVLLHWSHSSGLSLFSPVGFKQHLAGNFLFCSQNRSIKDTFMLLNFGCSPCQLFSTFHLDATGYNYLARIACWLFLTWTHSNYTLQKIKVSMTTITTD